MDFWAAFTVTRAGLARSQISVEVVSTLPASVQVTVRARGRTVLQVVRTIHAGRTSFVLRGRFKPGRYRVSLAGRSPTGLSRTTDYTVPAPV
jgi:hypothetical protein